MVGIILIWVLFIFARVIIWKFPPNFTDVVYSYYDYARLWSEGYTPYLKQLFEYGPANIIIFYFPRIIDQLRWLDYRTTYRLIVLLVDTTIFGCIIFTLKKLKIRGIKFYLPLIYYIATTVKAKDFIYDSMDLIFISGLFFYLILIKIGKQQDINRFVGWIFFWLSTAFKYITTPLVIPFLLIHRQKNFKQQLTSCITAFLIVWFIPLIIFRSSLSVSFIYHLKRGFQVESVPANIIRLINSWTKSEHYIEVYKNYDIVGPVTNKLTPFLSLLFPLAMIVFGFYSINKALKLSKNHTTDEYKEKIRLSLNFLLLFLLTGKVFSTPFHLWLPPLLAIYPFRQTSKQFSILIISFFMIAISMTPIPNLKFSIFDLHTAIGILRPVCISLMLLLLNSEK